MKTFGYIYVCSPERLFSQIGLIIHEACSVQVFFLSARHSVYVCITRKSSESFSANFKC